MVHKDRNTSKHVALQVPNLDHVSVLEHLGLQDAHGVGLQSRLLPYVRACVQSRAVSLGRVYVCTRAGIQWTLVITNSLFWQFSTYQRKFLGGEGWANVGVT